MRWSAPSKESGRFFPFSMEHGIVFRHGLSLQLRVEVVLHDYLVAIMDFMEQVWVIDTKHLILQ